MAVLRIACPDCGSEYRSLVVAGAKVPTVWVCSECSGRRARVAEVLHDSNHPWSGKSMDDCCG